MSVADLANCSRTPLNPHWKRAAELSRAIVRGAFPGSQTLHENYYLERLDPRHLYQLQLKEKWLESADHRYLDWLEKYRRNSTGVAPGKYISYLTPQEARKFSATISGGKLLLNPDFPKRQRSEIADEPSTRFIYIVDRDHNLRVCPTQKELAGEPLVKHCTFTQGAPIRVGGFMVALREGTITYISCDSGHYRSPPQTFYDFIDGLRKRGQIDVASSTVVVQPFGRPQLTIAEFLRNGRELA